MVSLPGVGAVGSGTRLLRSIFAASCLANALSFSAAVATRMNDGSAMWVSRTAKPIRAASSIR